jgi:hypothetical protein
MTISSPVWGLRPRRSRFWRITKVPKPVICTFLATAEAVLDGVEDDLDEPRCLAVGDPSMPLVDNAGDVGLRHGECVVSALLDDRDENYLLTGYLRLRFQALYE